MRSPAITKLRGVVTILVRGEKIEQLVNELAGQGIEVWDVMPLPGGQMEMKVGLSDFFACVPF
ncbi:hypothetical protein HMSSN036_45970 [Paenibacillus macerans]|nr:hypothetical protein HMSSN036_45970 [Paenibacillus macerans]